MKPGIYLFLLIASTLCFSSCKKCFNCVAPCAKCVVVDADGLPVENWAKTCGEEDINAAERACSELAATDPGYTCTCEELPDSEYTECMQPADEDSWLEDMANDGYSCEED